MKLAAVYSAGLSSAAPRRRRLLLIGLALVGLLGVLALALAPARERMRRQVLEAEQDLSALQAQAGEARRLSALAPAAALGAEPALPELQALATRAGLGDLSTGLRREPTGEIRLEATLSFDRWVQWVGQVHRSTAWRVISCRVLSTEQPGWVKVDAVFSPDRAR